MRNFSLRSGCASRFLAMGLPSYISIPLTREIEKLERNSGPKWTCNRLKSIKTGFVRRAAGLDPLVWIRKNRSGEWHGVWKALWVYSQKSPKAFGIVLNSLMVYSGFRPNEPDAEHLEDLKLKLETPEGWLPPEFLEAFGQHVKNLDLHVPAVLPSDIPPLWGFQGSSEVKSPVFEGSSVPSSDYLELELNYLRTRAHQRFLNRFSLLYRRVFRDLEIRYPEPEPYEPLGVYNGEEVYGGNLAPLVKDGGWKVRWIANPYRIHQLALKPLGSRLFKLISEFDWDCTRDQAKAIPKIQQHLAEGKVVHSVDLSSATDLFPLSVQLKALEGLRVDGDPGIWWESILLFKALSRAKWKTTKYGDYTWKKGQPMGLYPSFAAFALTHGLLLDFLSRKPGSFFILGDDVVILDDFLFVQYIRLLDMLGCPHSPSKSLSSPKLAEFAGKVITSTAVFPQFKWKAVNEKNFLAMMGLFGQKFASQLSRRELQIYHSVARLLPPYGLNHSLGKALPLETVVAMTDEFQEKFSETRKRKSYMSFLGFLKKRLRPYQKKSLWNIFFPSGLESREGSDAQRTFDEKVQSGLDPVFPGFKGDATPISDLLGDTNFGLPPVVPQPSYRTTLEIFEEKLGIRAED